MTLGYVKRKESYNPKSWEVACDILTGKDFPDKDITELVKARKIEGKSIGESHEFQRGSHSLVAYEFAQNINGFPIFWKYNACPICKKVFLKVGTLLNEYDNLAYRRYFMREGDVVSQRPKEKTMFSVDNALEIFDGVVVKGGEKL
jgi:hypothetical protein